MARIPEQVAALAAAQCGLLTRAQLRAFEVDWSGVRTHVRAGRWMVRTPVVVSTFTGELDRRQLEWLGALHAGGTSLVGGYTALERHGLKNWPREHVTILVNEHAHVEAVPGIVFVRTRRDLASWRDPHGDLPLARVEPAALPTAGYDESRRTAQGLLAAVVQQRLSNADLLRAELDRMRPLRWSRLLRVALDDIAGGAASLGEIDVRRLCRAHRLPPPRRQVKRKDSAGRTRFTDCEWLLDDGTVLVLEVDGGFHMEAEHWEDDLARQRRLSARGRIVVRCTTRELRDEPAAVAADLIALGLTRSCS